MKLLGPARLRLTAWYVIIVAIVSLSFSAIIYRDVTSELERGFRVAESRLLGVPFGLAPPGSTNLTVLADEFELAKRTVILKLAVSDLVVIVGSGVAAYVLAGKTLSPVEDAMDKQKRFIADASHELRTPMTALKSEVEVALRNKRLSGKEAKELLKSNLEEVDKMQKLTTYLLALSRYESGVKKLTKEHFDLKEVVESAVSKHIDAAMQKGIKISTKLKSIEINANKTSIEELISILIDNAVKYTDKNGKIKVSTIQEKKHAVIKVSDTGVGIKATDIPYIFNRFYRADTSRSKVKADGYGLGLSIAKSVVSMHKGDIKVDSTPSSGTTFKVTLPLS